jgi:purine-nucleoside phosphorylase
MSVGRNQVISPAGASERAYPARKTAARIAETLPFRPVLAMVLGSGFHGISDCIEPACEFSYGELPGFPRVQVDGHRGKLVVGRLGEVPVLALCGRAHYYEGIDLDEVTFGVRVVAALGIPTMLLTNASGAINVEYRPGDFMCIRDHINFLGINPLRGQFGSGLNCFVDLSRVYDPALVDLLLESARDLGIPMRAGVYLAVCGPTYETPAEIRAFRILGADAVGMSTVPEAIVARQCGLRVAGLSCITNLAAGLSPVELCHAEVLRRGREVQQQGAGLLTAFAARLWKSSEPPRPGQSSGPDGTA